MYPQCLSYAQVQHDLLRPARNSIRSHIPIQPLNFRTLPTAAVAQSSEDLTRLSGTELEGSRRLGFQACNGSSKLQHRFCFGHLLALVDDVLQPVVARFDLASHVSKLEADDGMIDEPLAECLSLMGVFDGFLIADAGEPDALNDDTNTFVVEVCHNH